MSMMMLLLLLLMLLMTMMLIMRLLLLMIMIMTTTMMIAKQASKQTSKQAEKQTVRLLSGGLFYCQIPEGIVCPGRIKTKPFPTMPNRFSLIGEVLDHDRQVVTYMEVRRPSCPPHPELLLFAG